MTHQEEIERVAIASWNKMFERTRSIELDSHSGGTVFTRDVADIHKELLVEALYTHTLQEASWWHQKHREYVESLTEGNRDASIHIHQLMRERIDSMKKEVMNKTQ